MSEHRQRAVPPSATGRGATHRLLIDVAERLFAERGLDAVSLRAVAQEAGQRNNSAAQYHFGSREGLLRAIIETRSEQVESRRAEQVEALRASGRPPTVRDMVALFVVPLAGCVGPVPGHYLRFLARVVEADGMASAPGLVHPEGLRHMHHELRRLLPDLPPSTFERRLRWLAEIALRALADVEGESAAGRPPRTAEVVDDLLAMLEALLLSPGPRS